MNSPTLFICPYCGVRAVPAPPETPRPHAQCSHCGAHPRATITHAPTGEKLVRYVRDGRKPLAEPLVQTTVTIYRRQKERYSPNLSETIREALDAYDTNGL